MARPLVATRVDPEAYRRLKELSGREDRSVAWLARKAIEVFLDRADGERTRPERKGD
jgi:predicted transcriptional regulator